MIGAPVALRNVFLPEIKVQSQRDFCLPLFSALGRIYFFILRRIRRGSDLLNKLEEREGSTRITYSRDCGGWLIRALKLFYNWRIGIVILDDMRIVNVAPITILMSWEIHARLLRMRSRDTRLMACEDAPQVVYVNCLRSFTEEASIMLWSFWDWTGQVCQHIIPHPLKSSTSTYFWNLTR